MAKVVGWAIGLASLFSAFFLPFWNLTSGSDVQFDTLYGALGFTVNNLGTIIQWDITQVTLMAFLILGGAGLVALSGVLGTIPKAAGGAGSLGMVLLTVGPVLLFPGYGLSLGNFGAGFWALWVLSIANIFVGLALHERGSMAGSGAPLAPGQVAAPKT